MELPDLARSHHDILPSSDGPRKVSLSLATPFGNIPVAKLAPFAVAALVAGIVLAHLLAFRMRGVLLLSSYMGFIARGERPHVLAVVLENVLPVLSLVGMFTLASGTLLGVRSTSAVFAVLVPLVRLPLVLVGVILGSMAAAGAPVVRIFAVHRACQSLLFVVMLYLYYGAFIRAAGREKTGVKIIFIILLSLIAAAVVNAWLLSFAQSAFAGRPAAASPSPKSDDLPYRDGESIILALMELDRTEPSDFRQQIFFERSAGGDVKMTRHLYEKPDDDAPLHLTATTFAHPAMSPAETMILTRGRDRDGKPHKRATTITWSEGKATFQTRTDDGDPRTQVLDAPPDACWHEDLYLVVAALPLRDGYEVELPVLRQRLSLFSAAPVVRTKSLTCRRQTRPAWLPPGPEDDPSDQCFRVSLRDDLFSSPTYAYYDGRTRRLLGVDIVTDVTFARLAVVDAVASRPAGDFSLDPPADSR